MPGVQDLEWDVWLSTLTGEESSLGGEGEGSELCDVSHENSACTREKTTYWDGSLGTAVDQGVDGVSLVGVVGSEDEVGKVIGVVGEEG